MLRITDGTRRTREHIIADLSIVHAESIILPLGHVAERLANDYGYDLRLITFSATGFLEPDHVLIQVKATDSPKFLADGSTIAFGIERKHLWTWSRELVKSFFWCNYGSLSPGGFAAREACSLRLQKRLVSGLGHRQEHLRFLSFKSSSRTLHLQQSLA